MFRNDGEGTLVMFIIGIAVIGFIIYVLVLLASVIAGIAAAGGTIYGGGYAIKNYVSSFKQNVIDSNKAPAITA